MSIKKLILISFIGIMVGGFISLLLQPNEPKRKIASGLGVKPLVQGKMHRTMDVLVEPVGGIPDREDQDLTLRASIQLLQPVQGDLVYKWHLPEGVSLVSGQLEDTLQKLEVNQVATLEITVQGVARLGEIRHITLHAFAEESGGRIGGAGLFTNMPEQTFVKDESGFQQKQSAPKSDLKGIHF